MRERERESKTVCETARERVRLREMSACDATSTPGMAPRVTPACDLFMVEGLMFAICSGRLGFEVYDLFRTACYLFRV